MMSRNADRQLCCSQWYKNSLIYLSFSLCQKSLYSEIFFPPWCRSKASCANTALVGICGYEDVFAKKRRVLLLRFTFCDVIYYEDRIALCFSQWMSTYRTYLCHYVYFMSTKNWGVGTLLSASPPPDFLWWGESNTGVITISMNFA
jgi:hypothetical protein